LRLLPLAVLSGLHPGCRGCRMASQLVAVPDLEWARPGNPGLAWTRKTPERRHHLRRRVPEGTGL